MSKECSLWCAGCQKNRACFLTPLKKGHLRREGGFLSGAGGVRNSRESRPFQRAGAGPVGSVKGFEMIQQTFPKPERPPRGAPGSFLVDPGRTGESPGKSECRYNLARLLLNFGSKVDEFVKAGMPGGTVKSSGSNSADGVFTMPSKTDSARHVSFGGRGKSTWDTINW